MLRNFLENPMFLGNAMCVHQNRQMNSENYSPRRPEGVTPRRPPHLTTPGRGGDGGIGTGSSLGVVSFLKDLDRIQEQQIIFSKKLDKEKRRKIELEEQKEV
jgi:hypothetical protein